MMVRLHLSVPILSIALNATASFVGAQSTQILGKTSTPVAARPALTWTSLIAEPLGGRLADFGSTLPQPVECTTQVMAPDSLVVTNEISYGIQVWSATEKGWKYFSQLPSVPDSLRMRVTAVDCAERDRK